MRGDGSFTRPRHALRGIASATCDEQDVIRDTARDGGALDGAYKARAAGPNCGREREGGKAEVQDEVFRDGPRELVRHHAVNIRGGKSRVRDRFKSGLKVELEGREISAACERRLSDSDDRSLRAERHVWLSDERGIKRGRGMRCTPRLPGRLIITDSTGPSRRGTTR